MYMCEINKSIYDDGLYLIINDINPIEREMLGGAFKRCYENNNLSWFSFEHQFIIPVSKQKFGIYDFPGILPMIFHHIHNDLTYKFSIIQKFSGNVYINLDIGTYYFIDEKMGSEIRMLMIQFLVMISNANYNENLLKQELNKE